jgi:hypothetical protein
MSEPFPAYCEKLETWYFFVGENCILPTVLRIRDVYPGSEFVPSRIRIRIKEFKCF